MLPNIMITAILTAILIVIQFIAQCYGGYGVCGGKLTQTRGVIQSPNFPGPFQTPVFCEWVIQAPPKLKIVLYLTQYYLKGYFHVYEYDHYTSKEEYIGERKLATVNCEDEIWSITAHKPFVVIRFAVQEMGNIHLRVLDHLIDVYGFNITYELENKHEVDSKWTCSAFDCSYLGNCYASADFSEYKCHCFPNFSGKECEYGPHCNPMIDKNMCQNNGSCRYLLGDYVNICQCNRGFYGSMCEQRVDGLHPSACAVLDCEQTCLTTSSAGAACGCNHGFRLSMDNRTCVHIDQHKYNIQFSLINATSLLTSEDKTKLQQTITVMFQQRGVFSLKNFTISQIQPDLVEIELFVETTDRPTFDSFLFDVLGMLEFPEIDTKTLQITSVPELYLLSATMRVDTGSGLAALERKGMSLSCVARGPSNATFRWFKDGFLLDLSLFQTRAQETIIPSSRDDILRSVIIFDHVSPLDRGTFTCEVSDGHRTENKSLAVNVLTVPLVDLYPLSVSVIEGDSASIICMSPEDTSKNFSYSWYSGGKYIHPGRSDQIVEDLFPTGTRLFVPKVTKSENISCTVENKAGTFTLTSHVFIQKASAVNMTCGRSYNKQVLWKKTAGNHFDKERCPSETGDFSKYGPINEGYATRNCICYGEKCAWEEPNFAKCQSVYLVYEVYDKLEMLRLGYQQTTIKYVYNRLCEFIIERSNNNLYSGDVELAVSILHELLRHLEQYPQLAEKDEKISLNSLVKLINIMLNAANQSTWEEKQDMKAAPYFLRICQIISKGIFTILDMKSNTNQTSSALDVDIVTVSTTLGEKNMSASVGPELHSEYVIDNDFEDLQVISFTNKAILSMLAAKAKFSSIGSMKSISNVHSVFPLHDSNIPEIPVANIPIKHSSLSDDGTDTHTACVSWEFSERDMQYGRWTEDKCTVVSMDSEVTICRCTLPGHFMVIVIPNNTTVMTSVEESYSYLPLIIACIINIIILGFTMLVYVIRRTWLIDDVYPIHFSLILSMLVKSVTFLVCLKYDQASFSVGRFIVYFCFMTAFSSVFAESVQICMSTGRKNPVGRQWHKLVLIGCGIPAVLTVFFGVAAAVVRDEEDCLFICWIRHGQWHFYGFIVPIIALDIAVLTMLIFALRSCLKFQDEARYTPKGTFGVTCMKTLSILVLLNVTAYCSIFIHVGCSGCITVYSVIFCLLAVVVFMVRCICDKEIMPIFWKRRSTLKDEPVINQMKRKQSSSSFKAYMKPEMVEQSPPERKGASNHYAQVNRMNFTDERKRQLSFLLGSSQSGGNHENHNQENISHRSLPHENCASDSGISGSENERFLNCEFESSNHIPSTNRKTIADVHMHGIQNGFVVHGNITPFPELVQRQACKDIILNSSGSNGTVRPKYTYIMSPKETNRISESGESTTLLLQRQVDDKSDGNESDSV